ncbi:MAG: hypothetical protein ACT4QG_21445 [Sporichthyaceae bacterium]
METVTVSRTFAGDLDKFVDYTRRLDSRRSWPGSVLEYEQGDTLHYGVGMRLKGATMTDIHIEERLGDVEHLEGGGIQYSATQRVLWPDGHADAIVEYVFSAGAGAEHSVQFTYSYPPPSTKLVKTKALPEFHAGMEKVAGFYLKKLVETYGALVG